MEKTTHTAAALKNGQKVEIAVLAGALAIIATTALALWLDPNAAKIASSIHTNGPYAAGAAWAVWWTVFYKLTPWWRLALWPEVYLVVAVLLYEARAWGARR
jgi:hypothetical protein